MTQFAVDWTRLAGPVHAARVARIFHLAAAVLAAGVIAGLYLRGIALEYRATWESTFLDASSVRRVLAVVLAPGAALTGLEIPSTAHIETIRAPATENAARWLHLMAATVAAVVIVPRLLLALLAWLLERRRAAHIPLDLDGAYYQRILRGFHGAPARVHVVPYSYTPAAPAVAGLERLIARAFGAGTALTLRTPVAYGAETGTGIVPIDASSILVLFNAAATPERETHGGFLGAIATERGSEHAPIVLVDESALRTRWGSDGERMEQRRRIWRELCAEHEVPCAFVDLANGESTDGEAALERALDEAAR